MDSWVIVALLLGIGWLIFTQDNIMAKITTLGAALTALADQTDKIGKEIQALKDALVDVEIPADAQAALDRLTASIKTADDLNEDAPPAA